MLMPSLVPLAYVGYHFFTPNVKDRAYNIVTLLLVFCVLRLLPLTQLPTWVSWAMVIPPVVFGCVVGPVYTRVIPHIFSVS